MGYLGVHADPDPPTTMTVLPMRPLSRTLLGLLAAALLTGCSDEGELPFFVRPPAAAVSPDAVTPGQPVTYTVRNESMVPLWYGACAHSVDRRVGQVWVTVRDGRQSFCLAAVMPPLEPGASIAVSEPAPAEEGVYRARFHFLYGTGARAIAIDAVTPEYRVVNVASARGAAPAR